MEVAPAGVLLAPLSEERKGDQASHERLALQAGWLGAIVAANGGFARRAERCVAWVARAFTGPCEADMRIALFEPDIPQNTGTILRLCACLGVEAHLIEPAGFPSTDRAFRRAGMDYIDQVTLVRHVSWTAFDDFRRRAGRRLVLFTTHATTSYLDHRFWPEDMLLLGRETAGVPQAVHACADVRLLIPMRPGVRSINVALAGAMALGEAIRQVGLSRDRSPPLETDA
jgi:tRNA (cytidine/uridine-2'-O-)-methyltransferase